MNEEPDFKPTILISIGELTECLLLDKGFKKYDIENSCKIFTRKNDNIVVVHGDNHTVTVIPYQ